MKTTIEHLEFPSEIRNKLTMKVSKTNLNFEYLSGNVINFNNTNLSITEPHKVIVNNGKVTLLALFYENSDKVYLPNQNVIVSFTKYISILNHLNSLDLD